jgi:hypothetical protein
MNFVQTMLGPNPAAAFDLFSKDGQVGTNRQQLEGVAATILRPYDPKNVTVEHTYVIAEGQFVWTSGLFNRLVTA